MVDADAASHSGVEHGALLLAFSDAVVGDDDTALAAARAALIAVAGTEALVDAAGVASNFQRMVRIADATGIPLDVPLEVASKDLREDLGLGRFAALHVET